jgi:glutamine synthetase
MLCDIFFADGSPVPFSARAKLQDAEAELARRGWSAKFGIEAEFHILKVDNWNKRPEDASWPGAVPDVSLMTQGFQYLTEARADEMEPVTDTLRRACVALGLPVRSVECEFGPSQVEFTFAPMGAVEAADALTLFRSMVKQVCRRQGLHATFMCRPQVPNLFASGLHIHQSLVDTAGKNLFVPEMTARCCQTSACTMQAACWPTPSRPACSPHLRSTATSATSRSSSRPTGPIGAATTRVPWCALSEGPVTRRRGWKTAQPKVRGQSVPSSRGAGVGRSRRYRRGPQPRPACRHALRLRCAHAAHQPDGRRYRLDSSDLFRNRFGSQFIDYLVHIKRAEIARFLSEVTDWEQREYFDIF